MSFKKSFSLILFAKIVLVIQYINNIVFIKYIGISINIFFLLNKTIYILFFIILNFT